jgi:hypothetical protein
MIYYGIEPTIIFEQIESVLYSRTVYMNSVAIHREGLLYYGLSSGSSVSSPVGPGVRRTTEGTQRGWQFYGSLLCRHYYTNKYTISKHSI